MLIIKIMESENQTLNSTVPKVVVMAQSSDWEQSAKIREILRVDFCQYESKAEQNKKKEILGKLDAIIQEWIQMCGKRDGKDENTIYKSGGKIFTFGSYRLGVNGPGSDIDALCVAPRHIERNQHFFGVLAPMLKANPDVTEMTEVSEAFVPVIKMKFQDVDIDMLFARI
jgi:poly(A) polymerase